MPLPTGVVVTAILPPPRTEPIRVFAGVVKVPSPSPLNHRTSALLYLEMTISIFPSSSKSKFSAGR